MKFSNYSQMWKMECPRLTAVTWWNDSPLEKNPLVGQEMDMGSLGQDVIIRLSSQTTSKILLKY